MLAILASGLMCVGVEVALTFDGPVEPVWIAQLFPAAAGVWIVVGVLAWWRRSENAMGSLLVLGGAYLLLGGLVNSDEQPLISVGQITQTLILAVTVHGLLAFPSGRLQGRLPVALTLGAYVLSTFLEAARWLIVPGPQSPYSQLRVSDDASLLKVFADIQHVGGEVVLLGVIYVLVQRLRAAPKAQRRVLAPVYLWGMLAAAGIPLTANLFDYSNALTVGQVGVVLSGVPIAFALGLLLGGFSRTHALEELGTWLGSGDRAIVAAVAEALGDPSVELVHRTPTGYMDAAGAPTTLPESGSRRSAVEVEVQGRNVGAIVYDANLIADPETVRSAGRVVGLALEHDRLRAEIAVAADDARRSVAQDLHDGLQSRLVLLGSRRRLSGDEELRAGLDAAIDRAPRARHGVHARPC